MATKKLIEEVISLPVEERVIMVDTLLKSLNPTESAIDTEWAKIASKRLEDIRDGKVVPISSEVVFEKIWERLD